MDKKANNLALADQQLSRLLDRAGLSHSKRGLGWRVCEAQGQVNALPRTRGRAVATDGIMCVIQTEDGKHVLGHWDWFVKDEEDQDVGVSSAKGRKQKVMQEFIV